MIFNYVLLSVVVLWISATAFGNDSVPGVFSDQSDVGTVAAGNKGSMQFDPATKTYTVIGGGKNVWLTEDAFHFVWKKVPATTDFSLSATVEFSSATAGADSHRKALLMIRQSLDADSTYADACIHGNGMTAIQYRLSKGERTFETQAQANMPKRVRLEKRGDFFSMSFGSSDADLQPAGGACKVPMTGDIYIGIGVCAQRIPAGDGSFLRHHHYPDHEHDGPHANAFHFGNDRHRLVGSPHGLHDCSARSSAGRAPNWSRDNMLYFNNQGKMFKVKADVPDSKPPTAAAPAPVSVDLGLLTDINNDHLISPDGKSLAVSDRSQGKHGSAIWIMPIDGSAPPRQ